MDTRGQFIAALIDSSSKALAAGAANRLLESADSGEATAQSFTSLVADLEVRVRTLSEALAAGCPELLLIDTEWLKASYAARQVPTTVLEQGLRSLRVELAESLPADAVELATSYVDQALAAFATPPCAVESILAGDAPHVQLARALAMAILEGRRADAERTVLDAFDGGLSASDLHMHVISKAQAEIGRLWQLGEVHAAEEHLGSRIVEDVLAVLRSRAPRAPDNGRCVLTASVPGNFHDIGARMVADQFEFAGWRSLFLGADTPAGDLLLGVRDYRPDLVALSVGLGLNIRATARLIQALGEGERSVPVLVGGLPFAAVPELWRSVGADGYAPNAPEAVGVGERLVAAG